MDQRLEAGSIEAAPRDEPIDVRRIVRRVAEVAERVEVVRDGGVDHVSPGLGERGDDAVARLRRRRGAVCPSQRPCLRGSESPRAAPRRAGVQLVEAGVDGVHDLRGRIETHPERGAQARMCALRDDRSVADARARQDRGVEDLHGFRGELEHQGLVAHDVTQHGPHGPPPANAEVLEQPTEELVEHVAVHDPFAEPQRRAAHPQQRRDGQVPEVQRVDGVQREDLQQLLAAQAS